MENKKKKFKKAVLLLFPLLIIYYLSSIYFVKEIYYYDFTKNRKDNNGTYEDIVKNLSNFVTYNDRGVGEIYAPSLLVVSKDEVLLFDSDTSFVKGEITPSTYWNSITQNEKEQELREIFTKYLNN